MKIKELLEAKTPKKIEPSKPRNFVVKNQQTSGAGAHKDKKKAAKQGDVKHKKQYAMEGAEERSQNRLWQMITSYEQQAKATKNDLKKQHLMRMAQELRGKLKTSDDQGVEEGRHGYDDAGFSLAPGHDEGEPVYNPRYDRTGQYDRKAKYSQDYDYNTGKPLGVAKPQQKKGYVFYNVNDPATAQKLGLRQTKSGKWYLPADDSFRQTTANKVFGQGRVWYPKESVGESATTGATSAGNVAVGAVYKNKPAKAAKNKDGTVKNAQDMNANLLTGGSIKR